MDFDAALDRWRVGRPRSLTRADTGFNNLSHRVVAPEGAYFLRVHADTADSHSYEHALLERLSRAGLSFEVPTPLETETGDTRLVTDSATLVLFEEIPGEHPERGNTIHIQACGEALGELDIFLSDTSMVPDIPPRPEFGDVLSGNVSSLPDPMEMTKTLPVEKSERVRIRDVLEEMAPATADLYERLPRQVIHSDLAYGNVLVADDRVSGILDFEFAAPDLRALDFAIGMDNLCLYPESTEERWPLIEAFARGYGKRVKLTGGEISAVPRLVMLRQAAALVHWYGRFRAGFTTRETITARCNVYLDLSDWLRLHGDELVRIVERVTSSN